MAARHSIAPNSLRRQVLRLGCLVAVMWLGACSTAVLYNDPGPPNLQFRATSNGRPLTFVSIGLGIHRVTADCRTEFMGSHSVWAPLAQATDPVHLPEERLSLLEFTFHQHGNIESWTSYKTLLRPRAGQTYMAAITYDAGLFDVEIRETGPNVGPGRKIEQRSLSDCHRA